MFWCVYFREVSEKLPYCHKLSRELKVAELNVASIFVKNNRPKTKKCITKDFKIATSRLLVPATICDNKVPLFVWLGSHCTQLLCIWCQIVDPKPFHVPVWYKNWNGIILQMHDFMIWRQLIDNTMPWLQQILQWLRSYYSSSWCISNTHSPNDQLRKR